MTKGLTALALVVAALAPGSLSRADVRDSPRAPLVDVYIRGSVLGRVPGRNLARVAVRWDFKCFNDRLGAATYRWTLKVVRRTPTPERTLTLSSGTSKSGSARTRLAPGRYVPVADPFRCQTERGAGSTEPEIGAPFTVPDYCAWSVVKARGRAGLEEARAVRPLRRGDRIAPGNVVFTSRGSSVTARSQEGGSTLVFSPRSRARVDRTHCRTRGGWRLTLLAGRVRSKLAERDRTARYEIATPNAAAAARAATWLVESRRVRGKPWTRVRVQAGRVVVRSLVRGRTGRDTVAVRPGADVVVYSGSLRRGGK